MDTLIVEPGATLNTNSCKIYYNTLDNQGTVDTPANLVAIVVDSTGACCITGGGCMEMLESECNANYVCDHFAIAASLNATNYNGCFGDMDFDGVTTAADRGFVSANFNATNPVAALQI